MKLHKQVDILNHKGLQILLNLASIPIFLLVLFGLIQFTGFDTFSIDFWQLVLIAVLLVASLPIHELIHGLFFKLFHPKDRVKYGYAQGMLYATNPGRLYKRWQFMVIGIMPLILVTAILAGAFLAGWLQAAVFILVAAFHAAGCIGDLYFELLLIFSPVGSMVADTATGMAIYVAD